MSTPEILHDVSEILSELGKQQRDNLIAFNLPHFMSQGIGITKSMKIFREFGYKFADSAFRKVWLKVETQETLQRQVMYHNRMEDVPDEILAPTRYPINKRYLYKGLLTVYDTEQGALVNKSYAIKTSAKLKHYEIEESIRQGYLTDSDPRATVIDVKLVAGYINEEEQAEE